MKTGPIQPTKALLILLLVCAAQISRAQTSGRVVINEYMTWTSNGCGTTAEYVELLNFGPGPVNIGCYILTDGDYSVTIPPNTILQPGQFYVISGQDVIPKPCANIDSTIHTNLNWNTCGCTSGPIPTTGDGFFTDGGSANEQVVLLDPSLKVVDAVVRDLPVEPSTPITTSSVGGCSPKTFDLNTMSIRYETLGMSTGRGNTYARKLDGDCGWEKDPQQSAHATNNTSGATSDVSYSMTIVQARDCDNSHGSIDIYVNVSDSIGYANLFPMNYTIARDVNNDGVFDFSDSYTYGEDSTPPSITILGLPLGTYKITVASVFGCFLKNFDVTILQCLPPLAHGPLVYFKLADKDRKTQRFQWLLTETEKIGSIYLERSMDGRTFSTATRMDSLHFSGTRSFDQIIPADDRFVYYRLHLIDRNGKSIYSPIVYISGMAKSNPTIWPNPASDKIHIQLTALSDDRTFYRLYNMAGVQVKKGVLNITRGTNDLSLDVKDLSAGTYQLVIAGSDKNQPISLRFVKH